jgi:hexosaminidase
MRKLDLFLLIFLVTKIATAKISLIPQPQDIRWGNGNWSIPAKSEICYQSTAVTAAKWLQKLVQPLTKVTLVEMHKCKTGSWFVHLDPKLKSLGNEGYKLQISRKGVLISSAHPGGLFYAIQTLRQLLPAVIEVSQAGNGRLPIIEISDFPVFSWRGSMLDVARSFFDVEYVKHHIDRMALFKLNRLHLHLTDDQGWRIEIKSYPNLTQHGGSGAVKNGRSGYYTQAQYKEIQKYAKDRHIVVIPEIEMPGHSYAALSSYPELNCPNFENLSPRLATPPELYQGVRVKWNRLCIEKPEVKSFVSSVLREISEMTDGPWIHFGADEVNITNIDKFIDFVDTKIYSLGKVPIGWEEVLQFRINPKTIAQLWTKSDSSTANPKIISLCQYFYLDHSNDSNQNLPNDWCKKDGVSLEDLYAFSIKDKSNILGIEAPLWTEFAHTTHEADDRLWPRLTAAAEIAWSQETQREIKDFRLRLGSFGERFDLMGIHFFETPTVQWIRASQSDKPRSIFFNFSP